MAEEISFSGPAPEAVVKMAENYLYTCDVISGKIAGIMP